MEDKYIVYIRVDHLSRIIEVNSSEFIADTTSWIKIDEGEGDRFHHAQNNYFEKSLTDERDIFRYKYEDGSVVERSSEEMDADYVPPARSTDEEQDDILAELSYEIALMQLGMEV